MRRYGLVLVWVTAVDGCAELSTGRCPQGWPVGRGVGTVVGMRGWWRDLTDLVLPAECGGCGRPRTVLCPECRAALNGAAPSRVRPMPEPMGLPATYAAAPYADEVRAALLAHKERGALGLAGALGAALAGAVRMGLGECGVEGYGGVAGRDTGLLGVDGGVAGLGGGLAQGCGELREEAYRGGWVRGGAERSGWGVGDSGFDGGRVGRSGAPGPPGRGEVGQAEAEAAGFGAGLGAGFGAVPSGRGQAGQVPGRQGQVPRARQAQAAEAAQARAGHRQDQVGQARAGHRQEQVRQVQAGQRQPQGGWHVDAGRVPSRNHGHGHGQAPVLLVPVPSARSTVRARGHDPARRIALAAAGELRRTGTPARVVAVLRQRRWVADQSGLNSRQRLDNLAGALEVVAGAARLLASGPVVLVDDLMTTGASLREAARAVREAIAGGGEVGATAAVYARVSREGREEHIDRSNGRPMENGRNMALSAPGIVRVNGPSDLICAAVIAASPDSFEINRN